MKELTGREIRWRWEETTVGEGLGGSWLSIAILEIEGLPRGFQLDGFVGGDGRESGGIWKSVDGSERTRTSMHFDHHNRMSERSHHLLASLEPLSKGFEFELERLLLLHQSGSVQRGRHELISVPVPDFIEQRIGAKDCDRWTRFGFESRRLAQPLFQLIAHHKPLLVDTEFWRSFVMAILHPLLVCVGVRGRREDLKGILLSRHFEKQDAKGEDVGGQSYSGRFRRDQQHLGCGIQKGCETLLDLPSRVLPMLIHLDARTEIT